MLDILIYHSRFYIQIPQYQFLKIQDITVFYLLFQKNLLLFTPMPIEDS